MRMTVTLGLATLLAVGAAVAGDGKGDAAKLQGKWMGELEGKKAEFHFKKDSFIVILGGQEYKGNFKIDPAKKPREMDLKVTDANRFVGDTALAIYELDGDTLKWCANEPGKEARPKEFPAEQGGEPHLYLILKRVKD